MVVPLAAGSSGASLGIAGRVRRNGCGPGRSSIRFVAVDIERGALMPRDVPGDRGTAS
jgi:hypothetical protein